MSDDLVRRGHRLLSAPTLALLSNLRTLDQVAIHVGLPSTHLDDDEPKRGLPTHNNVTKLPAATC